MIHPDDRKYVVNGKLETLKLKEKKKDIDMKYYKLMYECSLKDKQGEYRRFHHKYKILELDEDGDIRLLLLLINEIGEYDEAISARGMCICNWHTQHNHTLDNETCLTKTEIKVLKLLAKGLKSSIMAKQLDNSIATINNHRGNILKKLGANNVAQAVNYGRIMEIII
jgi:DNA-binding CsgD family transcriptional regulator